MKKGGILVLLLWVMVLAGCAVEDAPEPQEAVYTVRFLLNGEEISSQQVVGGETPQEVPLELLGVEEAHWETLSGEPASPENTPVTADTVYRAQIYPSLNQHTPYLFADKDGNLRPEDTLRGNELRQALRMLADPEGLWCFPEMPDGNWKITTRELRIWLEKFYAPETVEESLAAIPAGEVSRSSFAKVMNRLLGRVGETVEPAGDAAMFEDVTLEEENLADLLEASIPHMLSDQGNAWDTAAAALRFQPGYFLTDGQLYYADEEGRLARDTLVGTMQFDADGRYTSGDEELDAIVRELIRGFVEQNPEATREELLQIAYEYCRDSFEYLRRDYWDVGSTGWEVYSAKIMFDTGRGNCYNYAAAMWALARGLGYDAWVVSGYVAVSSVHGWTEMVIDEKTYILDARAGRYILQSQSGPWNYVWP